MNRARVFAAMPLLAFAALAGLAVWGMLGARVDRHASPLVGQPAPALVLPALGGGSFDLGTYRGKPVVLNLFASWCAPCRVEHPQLLQLSKDSRFALVGLAYRDDPSDTARFLDELGNPFAAVGVDRQGAAGVSLGLTGVPETYVISSDGVVLHKHTGEVTPQAAAEIARIAARGRAGR